MFKSGGPKPNASGGKWSTQTIHIMHYADEHYFTKDVVGLVVFLHKRQIAEGVFDNDEAA